MVPGEVSTIADTEVASACLSNLICNRSGANIRSILSEGPRGVRAVVPKHRGTHSVSKDAAMCRRAQPSTPSGSLRLRCDSAQDARRMLLNAVADQAVAFRHGLNGYMHC